MGTISSSTGLISGMDIEKIVSQLMTIEKKPLTQLQTRVTGLQTQQAAYSQISARIMAALPARLSKLATGDRLPAAAP